MRAEVTCGVNIQAVQKCVTDLMQGIEDNIVNSEMCLVLRQNFEDLMHFVLACAIPMVTLNKEAVIQRVEDVAGRVNVLMTSWRVVI